MKKILLGLLLLYIGCISLLQNVGFLNFNWFSICRLWPIILLFIGLNIFLRKFSKKIILWTQIITLLFILGFITYVGLSNKNNESDCKWQFEQHFRTI